MQIKGRHAAAKFAPVLDELHNLTKTFPRTAHGSFVEMLVANGRLQREGDVWWVAQGVHGVVYVSTRHTQRGRPIVGRQYSLFLFDPYRRTYKFAGKADVVCEKWQASVLRAGDALYEDGLRELKGLVAEQKRQLAEANTEDARGACKLDLANVEAALADTQRRFEAERPAQLTALKSTAACVGQALQSMRGQLYPSIDIFLRQLSEALSNKKTYMPAPQLVHGLFDLLRHCNGVKSLEGREIWPLFENDSWRCTTDNYFGLRLDNWLRTGKSTRFTPDQVFPWRSRDKTRDDGPRLTPGKYVVGDFLYKKMCKPTRLSVSHAALRDAFRSYQLACQYFDERVQRGVAVRESRIARLPDTTAVGQAQHDAAARMAAITALRAHIPIHDPVLASAVRRQRRAQRRAMELRAGFPVFANVPWKVNAAEAMAVRDKHFCFFKSIPRHNRAARTGNCNTIAAALIKHAETIDARTATQVEHKTVHGPFRTFGRKHALALPQCPS